MPRVIPWAGPAAAASLAKLIAELEFQEAMGTSGEK